MISFMQLIILTNLDLVLNIAKITIKSACTASKTKVNISYNIRPKIFKICTNFTLSSEGICYTRIRFILYLICIKRLNNKHRCKYVATFFFPKRPWIFNLLRILSKKPKPVIQTLSY